MVYIKSVCFPIVCSSWIFSPVKEAVFSIQTPYLYCFVLGQPFRFVRFLGDFLAQRGFHDMTCPKCDRTAIAVREAGSRGLALVIFVVQHEAH